MKGKRSKAEIYVTDIQPGFVDTSLALEQLFGWLPQKKQPNKYMQQLKLKKKKSYITKRWRLWHLC